MPKVLISDKLSPHAATIFEENGIDVDVKPGLSPDALKAIIADYDGLAIRSATKVTVDILNATKNLKVFDKVDLVIGVSSKVINNLRVKTKVVSNWWSPFYLNNDIKKVNEYALSVGKLEKAKGFDLLIKSWKDINLDLIIVGSGDEYKNLKSLISSYKLYNKIKI